MKVRKPKTYRELKSYHPGWNCECSAWGASECGCGDADWTPTEVYRLRLVVNRLRKKIKKLNAMTFVGGK